MRAYETLFILESGLEQDILKDLIVKVEETITKNQGKLVKTHSWGSRPLAYRIDGNRDGEFYLIDFDGNDTTLSRLQRFFLINSQDILRFNIIRKPRVRKIKVKEKKAKPAKKDDKNFDSENQFFAAS